MTDITDAATTADLGSQRTLVALLTTLQKDGRRTQLRTADGEVVHGVITEVYGASDNPFGLVTIAYSKDITYYVPLAQITRVTDDRSSRAQRTPARGR